MTSSREQIIHNQLLCWNCEEIVHEQARVCPYCNVDLHRQSKDSKITHLSGHLVSEEKPKKPPVTPSNLLPSSSQANTSDSSLAALSSLGLLFLGTAFLFLGILVALFSQDGVFTLSWAEHHWPLYVGGGIALSSLGLLLLKKVE